MNLEEKIFDKIANAKDVNFETNSKEKLINIIHNDVYNVANFSDLLATRTARLWRLILTIGAIFLINVPVACVIRYFQFFYSKLDQQSDCKIQ